MSEERTKTLPELRGLTPDGRAYDKEPYKPASYCAQYGIPLGDCEQLVEEAATHGEVMASIRRTWLNNSKFREAAINHDVRPIRTLQQRLMDEDRGINV